MKKYLGVFLVALFGAGIGAATVGYFGGNRFYHLEASPQMQLADLRTSSGALLTETPDFVHASAASTPAVVHIKSYFAEAKLDSKYDFFRDFFGEPFGGSPGQASGSGVVITEDGYIATNNHVVKGADRVEVVLNDKRSYMADVIGTDPSTDLALLKINESDLAFLPYGNSDQVQIGEWVLAVGNPFNLTSTVTAGIVSAKGRNLNLLRQEYSIESFIQTDAAVNPGNSGGALINTKGELIGINTAIASETGSYAGYSFAVPVNIVRKVMADLREFGVVQRGIIGVQIQNITSDFAKENNLSTLTGAYVTGLVPGGAAAAAGIQTGDVIVRINDHPVKGSSELQEIIGTYRPGDKVKVSVMRGSSTQVLEVVLRNREGNTELLSAADAEMPATNSLVMGAELEKMTFDEKRELGIESGVRVKKTGDGKLKQMGMEDGFIITMINKEAVNSPEEVSDVLAKSNDGRVFVEGVTRDGSRKFYVFE
jgi:Do/DeqQ family serine protease